MRPQVGVLARCVAEADADDDERERDPLQSTKSTLSNRLHRECNHTYDNRLQGVETDVLCIRAGDVRGEEGNEGSGVERGGLYNRLQDARAFPEVVLFDFVVGPHDAPRDED